MVDYRLGLVDLVDKEKKKSINTIKTITYPIDIIECQDLRTNFFI